jgi:hypothetical protein
MSEESVEAVASGDKSTVEIKSSDIPDPSANKPWYDGLVSDESILTDKDREYKSFDEYVKGAHSARQMAHGKLAIPGENATDEDKAAFKAEAMKHIEGLPIAPESAEKYELEYFKDEAVASALGDERMKDIKADIHKIGLSNDQANKVMELYGIQIGIDGENFKQSIKEQQTATDDALKKEWGDDYADRMKGIDGIKSRYSELFGMLSETGISARTDMMKLLDELARGTNEDSPVGGGGQSIDSIEEEISKLQKSPEFMGGDANKRREINERLNELYKLKVDHRK